MTLVAAENISLELGERTLFENLSFSIYKNDKIGLVGPNGIGKTTLFEIIAGRLNPDDGRLVKSRECAIGYAEQELDEYENLSLFDYVASARQDLLDMRDKIRAAETALAENPNRPSLIEELGQIQHKFEVAGGYRYESELKIILVGLGFPENRFHNRLDAFSGGEKNRASLARILAGQFNCLLLDEPTNHLDIESTIWLEEYLGTLEKAVIIVSHDRTFLNNTVEKVWEIASARIEQYFNGFESYLEERTQRRDQLTHQYKHQQEEIKRIEDFIRRNMAGQKTKQAQSKLKYLARIRRIELPKDETRAPTFHLQSGGRSYNLVLQLQDAVFGYGHHPLINDVSLNIYRGDRVGLIGRNGSGKTTMLKTILGELDLLSGSIKLGGKVDMAYFDQELSHLQPGNIVLDELWEVDATAEAHTLRSFLARFGFRGEDVFKRVSILSGGEKTKLALAKLLFHPVNFLVFDEPTNHLDIDSRQALEEALGQYNGTCLIVSHDRYFLNQVVTRIVAVENGGVGIYPGNYEYYRAKKESPRTETPKKPIPPERMAEYAEFKELSRKKGRLKKELRRTEEQIKSHESRLAKLDSEIRYNIPKADWARLSAAAEEKSTIEDTLLKLYHKLEELEKINAEYIEPDGQSD